MRLFQKSFAKRSLRFASCGLLSVALVCPFAFAEAGGEPSGTGDPPGTNKPSGTSKPPDSAPGLTPLTVPTDTFTQTGRWIQSGLRLEHTSHGVRVAKSRFPLGGEPRGLSLPEHLGGGFLFYQPVAVDGASATAVYRASDFTSELIPLARIPFSVRHISAGFDRLYVLGAVLQVGLDVRTGELLSLTPLPPLVTIEGLAFVGASRGLVQGPLVGVLRTEDSGRTWLPLPEAQTVLVDRAGALLLVRTKQGVRVVLPSGKLVEPPAMPREVQTFSELLGQTAPRDNVLEGETDDFHERGRAWSSAEERAFRAVVAGGVVTSGGAYGIHEGKLVRVFQPSSGQLQVESFASALSAREKCRGVPGVKASGAKTAKARGVEAHGVETAPLFVCEEPQRDSRAVRTRIYRLRLRAGTAPDLERVYEAPQGAKLLGTGPGAALLSNACEEGAPSGRGLCLVTARGASTRLLPPAGTFAGAGAGTARPSSVSSVVLALSHAFALHAEDAHLLWVDKARKQVKAVTLAREVNERGATKSTPVVRTWSLSPDHDVSDLVLGGQVLTEGSLHDEELNFWAVRGESFVGVNLGSADKPSYGAVQRPTRRAVFDGARAVLWGAAGFAKQSLDHGQIYQEVSLPYRSGDAGLAAIPRPGSPVEMGCSEVGCLLGGLIRLGYEQPEESSVRVPQAQPFETNGVPRYRFVCSSGGASSAPRHQGAPQAMPYFWEAAPPSPGAFSVGYSSSFPSDLGRLYVQGPKEAGFGRLSRTILRFVDPWSPLKIKSTSETPQLFSDAAEAQGALGLLEPSTTFRMIALDPSGNSGVFLLKGGTGVELYGFSEGQEIQRFSGAEELGLRTLVSAVSKGGSLFAGFASGRELTIVRLAGGHVEKVAEFSLGEGGPRGVRLVRTTRGDLGISMEGDDGLLVYPVSEAGALGEVLLVPHSARYGSGQRRPELCDSAALGFIVERDLTVTPYLENASGTAIQANAVQARFIVGHGEPCLESMTAKTRSPANVSAKSPGKDAIPLTLLNSDSAGNRQVLLCE